MNDNGEFLIQKRSSIRQINPNKWAFTGGTIIAGEKSEEGAMSETKEELGIDLNINDLEFLLSFKREHDFLDVWLARVNIKLENIKIQEEEVSEVKWVSLKELDTIINNGEFVPVINLYYDLFKKLLIKCHNLKN
ncbi:MAG: NUDIX domain-containing protein [Mollicutes bacterium]|nr:NUDIX domain-containing protein [Mollicutes bacterium]